MRTRKQPRTRRKPKAATSDVLGQARQAARISPKWRRHYNRLLQLRDHLRHRQVGLAQDARQEQPSLSTHMADAGTDTYDQDFALGILSSEQDALYEIEQALHRIRDGTYGICELTGKRIESERLQAIPWARFTAAAEKQLEKEGAVTRHRLGPRDTVPRERSK